MERQTAYRRGVTERGGKRYGTLPDGKRYRIYDAARPFLQIVEKDGETFLRVRQATEQGYADCPVWGCADLSYPNSELRRARTVGGGALVNSITCSHSLCVFVEL